MAGLADGSASLSMSGREELMALRQAAYALSHAQHILYVLYMQELHNILPSFKH